jgi:hypothetical protein
MKSTVEFFFEFFSIIKSAVKCFFNEISSGEGGSNCGTKGPIFLAMRSAVETLFEFFNEISSRNVFRIVSMKSAVEIFQKFLQRNQK